MTDPGSFACDACRKPVRSSELWFACQTCDGSRGTKRRRFCEPCGYAMRQRFHGPSSREGAARDERYTLFECEHCTTDIDERVPTSGELVRHACGMLGINMAALTDGWRDAQPCASRAERAAKMADFVVSTYVDDRDKPRHARFMLSLIPDLKQADLDAALRRCDDKDRNRTPVGAPRR